MDTQDEQTDQLAALVEAALPDPEPPALTRHPDNADAVFVTKDTPQVHKTRAPRVRPQPLHWACATGRPDLKSCLSARRYACWHELEPLLQAPAPPLHRGPGPGRLAHPAVHAHRERHPADDR